LILLGTLREVVATPDEEIGYIASEEYASRMASPRSASARLPEIHTPKQRSGSSQTHVESPLRKMSFPVNEFDSAKHDQALESETEDDVIHIDPPSHPGSKVHGGGYDPPTQDLGPHGGNTSEEGGWVTEEGYGAPILASDELAKHPGAEYLQPAISPELERERRGSADVDAAYLGLNGKGSRPQSRQNIASPQSLHRFTSHDDDRKGTPLDDVQEYEPLFPDSDEESMKSKPNAAKMRRSDIARHHFPSQDIWEDAPAHVHITTTVDSPEPPIEEQQKAPSKTFEKPQDEAARKEVEPEDQKSFLPEKTKRFAKPRMNADVMSDMSGRPGLPNRFPSEDIWEDAPSHVYQTTTIESPDADGSSEPPAPQVPTIPARPQRTRASETKETSPVDRKPPIIPDKPKPQVPARPAKSAQRDPAEQAPLTKTTSAGSTGSDTSTKVKPAVPARPGVGSKIAALQGGFMAQLNSRLQQGPAAPKVKEPEPDEEPPAKEPLVDARKGRAKGPARRKPAASPSGASKDESPKPGLSLSFAPMCTVFSISEDGVLETTTKTKISSEAPSEPPTVKPEQTLESVEHEAPGPEGDVGKAEESAAPETAEASVQTGQQDIKIQGPDGSMDEATAFIDGKASEPGNVVVDQEGNEHVTGSSTTQHKLSVEPRNPEV
jgi:hypothetical protein